MQKKTSKIPVDGVASFPTNFRLRNLAEKHQGVGTGHLRNRDRESTQEPRVRIRPDHEGEKYITQYASLVDKMNNIDLMEELGFTPHAAADFVPEQPHNYCKLICRTYSSYNTR